jgi:hypothetical protein
MDPRGGGAPRDAVGLTSRIGASYLPRLRRSPRGSERPTLRVCAAHLVVRSVVVSASQRLMINVNYSSRAAKSLSLIRGRRTARAPAAAPHSARHPPGAELVEDLPNALPAGDHLLEDARAPGVDVVRRQFPYPNSRSRTCSLSRVDHRSSSLVIDCFDQLPQNSRCTSG